MTAAESYQNQLLPPEGDVYKSLFENSPLPMWIYDLDTLRFLEVNDAAVHRYGYSKTEFLNMTTNELRPPDEGDGTGRPAEVSHVMKEWRGWRHRLKNGDIIEVEITTQGLRYKGRRAAFVIISNIVESSRHEHVEIDDRFRLIFESSSVPMVLLDPESGQIADANRSAAAFYGYTNEEMASVNFADIVVAVDMEPASAFPEFLNAVLENKAKTYHRFAGGETREVEAEGFEISAGERRYLCLTLSAASTEPAEQKTEQESPDSDRIARDVLELAPIGYYRRGGDGALLDVNPALAEMLGCTKEELLTGDLAASVFARISEEDESREKTESGPDIYHVTRKDGREISIEDYSRYISNGKDEDVHREGFWREVREEIEASVEKDSRHPVVMQLSDTVLFVRKSDFRVVEANKSAEMLFGLSHEGLLERTIFDLGAEGMTESLRRQLDDTGSEGNVFDNIYTRGDGSPYPVEIKSQLMNLNGEEILVTIARDNGEQKRAEAVLRNEEEKYRTIFEKSPVGILVFDARGTVTECNESLASIMSSNRESVIGLKLIELPNKELAGTIRRLIEGKLDAHQGDYRSFTANKAIHVRATFRPITSLNGQPAGGIAIFEDISEREKSEADLRESEKRYRLLYESSPVPYHLLDIDWKIVDVNSSWVDLLGYSRKEAVGKDFSDFVFPEQAGILKDKLDSFKSSGLLGNLEIEIVHKQGQRLNVAVEGKIIREPDGGIKQAQIMLYDITERKLAENALKDSEMKFRSLAESASSAIFMYQDNKVCYANPACSSLTGFSEQELLNMNFWDVVHPDFRELVKELGMARQRGEPVPNHFELKILTSSGDTRWVDFTAATASYHGELAVLGTAYDATDRKSAKNKLEESEEQRRILVDNSPDAILISTDGKLAYLNTASLKLLEAESAGLLVGRALKDIVAPESLARVGKAIDDAVKKREIVALTNEKLMGLAGRIAPVDLTAAPITYLGKRSIQFSARRRADSETGGQRFDPGTLALNAVPNSIVVTDVVGKILWMNPAFETLSGYSSSEIAGLDMFDLLGPVEQDKVLADTIRESAASGNPWHGSITCRRKDGTSCAEDVSVTPVRDATARITRFVWVQQDNMMRKPFEELLIRAKKLEGIGSLVSSVVHDYNNMLGVILGYGEVLRKSLPEHGPARVSVEAILSATRKGTDLTRQLLDFEQEGVMSSRSVDVNKAIKSMEDMFLKAIGEDISLDFVPLKGLWKARVDPIHLYEMMISLATNARDAIVDSPGTIEIKTSNVVVDDNFAAKHPGFAPGEYVMISFSDNGKGIQKAIQDRIFDPFITTKEEEHAPGLGLAAVYGMVKRNGGGITVRSVSDEGATFCIYLPRFESENDAQEDKSVPAEMLRSDKTVLVVEDQADLLSLVKQQLEGYGYKVMAAAGPEEAMDICEGYPGEIDVLLTDVVLPGINGITLAEKIRVLRPTIKEVYMSGYSAGALVPEGIIEKGTQFIRKPFTARDIAGKIYSVLHS